MKTKLRQVIARLLFRQVRRLRQRHAVKVVAVAGSIGKTSTKTAIAELLGASRPVAFQSGNYNVDVTIPLVFFGLSLPSLFNPFAWLLLFIRTERIIRGNYPYQFVVLELGTDGPGQLSQYEPVVHADVGVLTAITPEHMEYFKTLDAVAKEEGQIAGMSRTLLVNKDLVRPEHFPSGTIVTYGTNDAAVTITDLRVGSSGLTFSLSGAQYSWPVLTLPAVAKATAYSTTAAIVTAKLLGLSEAEIQQGLLAISPVPGRLQILKGANSVTIIDDTYNASPDAVKDALQALYDLSAPQKIALLGNMNELGGYSKSAHAEVGSLCQPDQLAAVVTLGPDANESLAAAAERNGCRVQRCESPVEAGNYIKSIMQPGAFILAKGSQNTVYAEEAVKILLADPSDAARLVRQSPGWMKQKRKQFTEIA